jgi:hypothetical protein
MCCPNMYDECVMRVGERERACLCTAIACVWGSRARKKTCGKRHTGKTAQIEGRVAEVVREKRGFRQYVSSGKRLHNRDVDVSMKQVANLSTRKEGRERERRAEQMDRARGESVCRIKT